MTRLLPLLAALTLFAALSSCGGGERTASIPSGTETGTTASEPIEPEPETRPSRPTAATRALARQISDNGRRKPRIPKPKGNQPTGLVVHDIERGSGRAAKEGDEVRVDYVGVSWSTGKEFDASWDREDFTFTIGAGGVIPGWDAGVAGMRRGGRRMLVIPPDLAYGPQGQPPDIGPNETLVFVIDVRRVG